MNQPYNLDTDVSEYFEFILKGNTYRFRYPTTREAFEAKKLENAPLEESKKYLIQFISKVDEKSPDFQDVIDDVNVVYWSKFNDMVIRELSNANKDSKNS